jgi:hypothetical protein
MSTALAGGRYAVTEAEETTRDWIAYSVDCPMCGEPAGFRCIYTSGPETEISAYGRTRDYRHAKLRLKGTMTVRPHYRRVNLALDRARQRALREQRAAERARRKAEPSGSAWPNEGTREIRAALNAFDRAEYEQMRDWLKNHGAILWGGERPDGSLRGETYAFG